MGFRYFTVNDVTIVYLFFFLWGNVLVAFSLFASVFFTKTRASTVVGYIYVFAVGILAQQLVQTYFTDVTTPATTIFLVQCIPQFVMYRGLLELANGVTFGNTGVNWDGVMDGSNKFGEIFTFLAVEWVVLMILTVYLEQCLPSPLGVKSSPLFPLYWLRDTLTGRGKKVRDMVNGDELIENKPDEGEFDDVRAERERVYADSVSPLRIYNLKKTYKGVNGLPDVNAVHNLTIGVGEGECFGFLGPNGAGTKYENQK